MKSLLVYGVLVCALACVHAQVQTEIVERIADASRGELNAKESHELLDFIQGRSAARAALSKQVSGGE